MPFTAYKLIATLLLTLLLASCDSWQDSSKEKRTTLNVVTRNGLTTYYQDKNGPTGFEYELAKQFAEHLGLELKIITVHSLEDLFEVLKKGQADIAAAGLTATDERKQKWLFSPSYFEVKQQVIYNRKITDRPKSLADLYNSNITVMASSSHSEIFQMLKAAHPQLQWHEAPDAETIDLLDMLENGEIDYSVIDSNEFIANRGFYPQLKPAFEVGESGGFAWALPNNRFSQQIIPKLNLFFNEIEQDGTLKQLIERFYSHAEEQEQIDTSTFAKAVEKKLPKYKNLIEKTARHYELDWRLLASISYQESHWNPSARSPTGVRGMMMLTQRTAREMNIANRLDAEQSLMGGAAYYKKIKKKLPPSLKEPDRTWFALAAYNIGLGHVKDVRKLTQKQGGDPDKWSDIKTRLPLLQKRRFYRSTRYGYARGQEALTYVQNIRHYYNYLEWSELSQNRTPPPKRMDQYLPDSLQSQFDAL